MKYIQETINSDNNTTTKNICICITSFVVELGEIESP